MVAPLVAEAIVALIQVAAQYAQKAGMSQEEADAHFDAAFLEAKTKDPNKLPDAVANTIP